MIAKGFIKWIIKAVIACAVALAIASGGCLLYYNLPVHYSNESGATDYKWETSKFYSRGTEGIALGKTNNDGFNNIDDYSGQQIDILFMGSSHGEAFNVAQDKSCVSRLNEKFGGDMYTYNIATSGHSIYHIGRNLNDAIETYKPTKYVVIECQSLSPKKENLIAAVDGTLPRLESESGGIIGLLQKIPFLRLIYLQISNFNSGSEQAEEKSSAPEVPDDDYRAAVQAFVKKIKNDCESHGVKPIIVYHPHFVIDENGNAVLTEKKNYSDLFCSVCEETGIAFADMFSDFVDGYKNDLKLPYGFSNTALGKGHLNEYGHNLLAERIYKIIEDMEAEK